jgi:hypothetical protein
MRLRKKKQDNPHRMTAACVAASQVVFSETKAPDNSGTPAFHIINYFDNYRLFGGKYVDYLKFRKVFRPSSNVSASHETIAAVPFETNRQTTTTVTRTTTTGTKV